MRKSRSEAQVKFVLALLAALMIFLFIRDSVCQNLRGQKLGWVEVIVTANGIFDEEAIDPAIWPDPNFKLYLRDTAGKLYNARYDTRLFTAEVPEGRYEIILRSSGRSLDYTRARFLVSASSRKTIRLDVATGSEVCDANGFVMLPFAVNVANGRWREYVEPGNTTRSKFDVVFPTRPFNLVINYCHRTSTRNKNTYRFARLTYKEVTVYANEIETNKEMSVFQIRGRKDDPIMIEINGCIKKDVPYLLNLNLHELGDMKCE